MNKQDTIISLLKEINENVDNLDTTFVTTDLAITENGSYKPIDYDVEGFNIVDVNVSPTLEEITITENGEYIPSEGVDGFSKVVATLPAVKIPKLKVTHIQFTDACVVDGVWPGDALLDTSEVTDFSNLCNNIKTIKKLDVSHWDVSKLKSMSNSFYNFEIDEFIGIDKWNISNKLTQIYYSFSRFKVKEPMNLDLKGWDVSNVTRLDRFLYFHYNSDTSTVDYGRIDLENWNTEKVTRLDGLLFANEFSWINVVGTSGKSITYFKDNFAPIRTNSIVGDYTIDDVINNNLKILADINISHAYDSSLHVKLNRASLRAIINGLTDLTGQTAQILTLAKTTNLTEEDIAVATAKNWTISAKW